MINNQKQTIGEIPIACSLTKTELAQRREALATGFFDGVQQVQELEDGYAFQFPGSKDWADKLLEFIIFERTCCQFFRFELAFEPEQGPIWLRFSGNEEVKAFVNAEFLSAN
jgi:hypothetical protein